MKRLPFLFVSAAVILLLGGGCAKPASKAPEAPGAMEKKNESGAMMKKELEKITVGVMLPFSGGAASYGESVKLGVELAKKEMNAQHVTFEFEDSKCEGKDAVAAINKLIAVNKVVVVIGELCSGATVPAAAVAEQNQIVMISPASTAASITDVGEFVFRTVPSDTLQGRFGAELVDKKGYRRLAVLYVNDDYGVGFYEVLKKEFPAVGGQIVAAEAVDRAAADVRTQLTKIKNANPDAIYVISNAPDTAATALKQIKEFGIKAAVFASEGLKSDDILKAAGAAAEGLIVTSVSGGTPDFAGRHAAEFGKQPGPFAAQGYDAMRAVILATEQGAVTGPEIRDAIAKVDFEGASGRITFDEKGDVAGNYSIFMVKEGKFVVVE